MRSKTDKQIDEQLNRKMDGWMNEMMDGWVDGWMNELGHEYSNSNNFKTDFHISI